MSIDAEPRVSPGTPSKKRRVGRPSQVSLDQILEAVSVIGLDRMTLQNLALALNVTPPALYRHVKSREDLVDKFVAHITARFPTPPADGKDWPQWAHGFAEALLDMYVAVPGLADYTIGQTHTSDPVLSRHETSISVARTYGFDEAEALYATRAVVEFVASWVAREQRRAAIGLEQGMHPDEVFRRHVLEVVPGRYPELCASLSAATGVKGSQRFKYTLDALIDGLARVARSRGSKAQGGCGSGYEIGSAMS
jgi:AcrR family transcriptional regulator